MNHKTSVNLTMEDYCSFWHVSTGISFRCARQEALVHIESHCHWRSRITIAIGYWITIVRQLEIAIVYTTTTTLQRRFCRLIWRCKSHTGFRSGYYIVYICMIVARGPNRYSLTYFQKLAKQWWIGIIQHYFDIIIRWDMSVIFCEK